VSVGVSQAELNEALQFMAFLLRRAAAKKKHHINPQTTPLQNNQSIHSWCCDLHAPPNR
jgi:hypothetical protein